MGQQSGLRRTVLLVEGNRNLARILGNALRDSGFVVTEVNAGQEALELLETQYPDAVVLDPDLYDGAGAALMERCRQIECRADLATVCVVISTLERPEVISLYGPPLRGFLSKPFDPWDLAELLQSELANRALRLERYRQGREPHYGRDDLIGSVALALPWLLSSKASICLRLLAIGS